MQALIERCCGLDVHQETVVACVLIGASGERPRKEIRTFRTMTHDLEALRDWLQELGVTQVGMESTGVDGARSMPCWKGISTSSSATPGISGTCRVARPM